MSIGDKWDQIMGTMDKESSFKLLDAFYDAGGNFIDTANGYQDETSEMFIGEWMESRGIRDQMVIATKVCMIVLYPLQGRGDDANSSHAHSTRPTSSEGGRTSSSTPAMSATT